MPRRAAWLLTLGLAGCSFPLEAPIPSLSGVSPSTVCGAQAGVALDLTGEGLSPVTVAALGPSPQVVLPRVSLIRTHDVAGAPVSEAAIVLPDDPAAPRDSALHWLSPSHMRARLDPALALPPGLYDVSIRGASGATSTLAGALEVTPAPLLLFADPPVAADATGVTLTLHTAGFAAADLVEVALAPVGAAGSPLVLCSAGGAGAVCPSLPVGPGADGHYGGAVSLRLDPNLLSRLPGTPAAASFDVVARGAGQACAATLAAGLRLVGGSTPATLVVSPAAGRAGRDTPVTITLLAPTPGLLAAGSRVYLAAPGGGSVVLGRLSYVSPALLSAVVPGSFDLGIEGPLFIDLDLTIVTPAGEVLMQPAAFRVSQLEPPRIDGLAPGLVPASGTSTVQIRGAAFQSGATAALVACQDGAGNPIVGTTPAVTYVDPQTLSLVVTPPAGAAPFACAVRVTQPQDGASDTQGALVFGSPSGNLPASRDAGHGLVTARRGHGAAVVAARRGARFLYAVGGDTGAPAGALASVEYAPLSATGAVAAAFATARAALASPRGALGLAAVGRALYAIGGADPNGTAVQTVERAVVLDPLESPALARAELSVADADGVGLAPGTWAYAVSRLYGPGDPLDPCGESLPSDAVSVTLPEGVGGLHVTLTWSAPDAPAGERQAAGYRLYRASVSEAAATALRPYADLPEAPTAFTDTGVAPAASLTGCPVASADQPPLALGETSRWVTLDANMTLRTARRGAGVRAVPDLAVGSAGVLLYAVSGLDPNGAGLTSYEVASLRADPNAPISAWEASARFTQVPLAVGSAGGGCGSTAGRAHAGLFLFNRYNASLDGAGAAITDDTQYLVLGPGLSPAGGAVGVFQTWPVDAASGLLNPFGTRISCINSAKSAGYGNVGVNRRAVVLGGVISPQGVGAVSWSIAPGSGGAPDALTMGTSFNNNGTALVTPRSLHAAALDGALYYLIGGEAPGGGVTATVELGLW
jgi:hypothetical protein